MGKIDVLVLVGLERLHEALAFARGRPGSVMQSTQRL
jgi:hypothetical protein